MLTGSGLGISAVVLSEIVPVLPAPLAGSIVDRLPRVKVMAADLVRVVLAGVLAGLA